MRRYVLFLFLFLSLSSPLYAQDTYSITELAPGVHAAIAQPGGAASSNALIVDLGNQVVLCGAHFSRKSINDLIAASSEISPNPISTIVLAHHHPGYSFIDFDIPSNRDVTMSLETRLVLKQEARQMKNSLVYFKEGMTLEGTQRTLVLSNVGPGHSQGDMIAYIPQSNILFTSDLLYFNSVGYLGAGSLRDWAQIVNGLNALRIDKIIPGFGPVGTYDDLNNFQDYLKAFLTEVLKHIENGDNLEDTIKNFSLPKYENLPGYQEFTPGNIERAYLQLKE